MTKTNLGKRLERLEALVLPASKGADFITVRFISPGGEVTGSRLFELEDTRRVGSKRRGGWRRTKL